jgi:putative membrane protein
MMPNANHEPRPVLRGALAGAVAGLAGTRAMSEAQRLWTHAADDHVPHSAGGKHDARDWQERTENQNANELAAQALATAVTGRCLTREQLRIAAPLLHYTFGSVVGALYGMWAERLRGRRTAAGADMGVALWLTADVIAMPLLGLSRPTTRRPVEMHLQSLAAHLVYGVTTECIRRIVIGRDGTPHQLNLSAT